MVVMASSERRGIYDRTTRGIWIYLRTPRLGGLLAVTFAAAAASAMVIVNTVVIVQGSFALSQSAVALALASFGAGSMTAALLLPKLLDRISDRTAMLSGATILIEGLLAGTVAWTMTFLLPVWFALGVGYSLTQTPSGRLLRRSAHPEDRPAVFAAQFALSHLCWLITYPVAGWAGKILGLGAKFLLLSAGAALATWTALRIWPADDPQVLVHFHDELEDLDPHAADLDKSTRGHRHAFVIDDKHTAWPAAP